MEEDKKTLKKQATFSRMRGIPQTIRAEHKKITVPSSDTGTYDITNPTVSLRTNEESSITIADMERLYWEEPLVNKALNIRANRVIGEGFELVQADGVNIDPEISKLAKDDCDRFLKKIGYLTFLRQSIINAYVAGNEWTELTYNSLGNLTSVAHGDFRTIDFRRNHISNKILLDLQGDPIGYWQYIENLTDLYNSLASTYGDLESYANIEASKKRLDESQSLEITNEQGIEVASIFRKPNYIFLKKEEIAHLSFNNLNDNHYGTSMIVPAYNNLVHLRQVMSAMAESINTMGYPKMHAKVGNEKHPPTEKMMDAADDMVLDPVRKEAFVTGYFVDLSYIESSATGSGNISSYPEWYVTAVATGLRVPRELLLGEGEANRATSEQGSSDFEKDVQADRRVLEEYIYKILGLYLKSKGYLSTDIERSIYVPEIKWPQFIVQDQILREKMVMDKWNAGLINLNEARDMLNLNEIEDRNRGEVFSDEVRDKPQDQTELDMYVGSRFEKQKRAQLALEPTEILDKGLNKEFKTEDVNYKKVAQEDVGKKIKSVSKSKAKKIRDIIVNGEAKGKSSTAIFEEVKKVGNYTKEETRRILATEQTNLVQHAKLEDAKNKGLSYKVWDSLMDKDTSQVCKALHGKKVKVGEKFKVTYKDGSGKTRRWSGYAPSAHPNCRSTLKFIKGDD